MGDDAPTYEAGDAVNVLPVNDPALVELWLERLGMKADSAVPGHDQPLADLLLRDWEIVTPTKDFVAMVAMKSGDSELAHVLEHNDKETLEDFLWNKDTLDLLIDFPQISLDLNEVGTLFRPLQHGRTRFRHRQGAPGQRAYDHLHRALPRQPAPAPGRGLGLSGRAGVGCGCVVGVHVAEQELPRA